MKDFILEGMSLSDRDVVLSIINSRFIIDYGTILQDNGDGTANVQHAVPMSPKYPPNDWVPMTPTVTNNVEVLYLSGGQFSTSFKVTIGDPVLLVGLKDFVKNTKSLDGQPLTVFNHYNQNTLKAIPLAGSNAMAIAQINVVNGLLQIKNQAQSLATILETFSTQGPPPYHMVAPDTIAKLQALLTP